jgi:CIC family chloride channel protein
MSGYFIGGIAGIWIPLTPSDHIVLTIVGMSSCLGTIVHAPLTSILIVFEMTHQFSILPGLMLGTIISQAIAHRSAGKINFYDAILIQDGHELHKIKPPVDLQSWQNLPISAIANPNPIYLSELNEEKMKYLLEQYPFKAFPVIIKNQIQGIVTREQIEDAVTNHNLPIVHEIGICYSDQTVNDVGNKFIEKTVHVLLVVDRNTTAIKGIITLHDLIRAQAATQS